MEKPDLKTMTFTDLRNSLKINMSVLDRIKADVAAINDEISSRIAISAKASLDQAGKDAGTVNLELQDGVTAKCVATKTVKWDSKKLEAVARTMDWGRVQKLFTLKFGMSETVYKGIDAVDPELRARIDEARTVTISEPKITLIDAK